MEHEVKLDTKVSISKCPKCKKETKFIKYSEGEDNCTLTCCQCNKTMPYENVDDFNNPK